MVDFRDMERGQRYGGQGPAARLPVSGVRRAAASVLDVFRQHLKIEERDSQEDGEGADLGPRRERFAPGEIAAMIERVSALPKVEAPDIDAGGEAERVYILLEMSRSSRGLARQLATRELRQLIEDLPFRPDVDDAELARLGERLDTDEIDGLPVLLQVLGDAARRELDRREAHGS